MLSTCFFMALTCHQLLECIFNDFFVFLASIKTYQPRELNRVSYLLCPTGITMFAAMDDIGC